MRTASKTPYEIRLELLQLAQTILHEKHAAMAADNALNNHNVIGQSQATTSPTTEEIITEANKLNSFVSNGSSA
jgi:hypothetical protein